jgi:hypothetical protein
MRRVESNMGAKGSYYGKKEKALQGGNRDEAGASKRNGDAGKIAKRNCPRAWR